MPQYSFCMPASCVYVFPGLLFKWPSAVLTILFLAIWLGGDKKCETLAFSLKQAGYFGDFSCCREEFHFQLWTSGIFPARSINRGLRFLVQQQCRVGCYHSPQFSCSFTPPAHHCHTGPRKSTFSLALSVPRRHLRCENVGTLFWWDGQSPGYWVFVLQEGEVWWQLLQFPELSLEVKTPCLGSFLFPCYDPNRTFSSLSTSNQQSGSLAIVKTAENSLSIINYQYLF